ncbi:PREDICTED: uncharacterized protein LOC108366931 [Rhagoletis zephyria]|uniref:uncharacterized protein LOC108366931 n=1 Tax=Rhagoletis zephyria TaxID=28612 RepID=UPI0008113460|nr:PREDICTED: uncharacterized protein LOC108366931 [Rhagoletis zephyria]
MAEKVIENEDETPETIYGVSYRTMIENFLRPTAEHHPNLWSQQNEATAHAARQTMDLLREIVRGRDVGKDNYFNQRKTCEKCIIFNINDIISLSFFPKIRIISKKKFANINIFRVFVFEKSLQRKAICLRHNFQL